jgi:dephospho-CoA kinase
MKVLGLTGSIGMGKSTAAAMLRRLRIPVHDADATVHRLFAKGGAAVPAIAAAFPGVVRDGAVDRAALGAKVFRDKAALRRLEAIVHPLVRAAEGAFLRRARREGRALVVLDIPLLFETGGERRCDAVAVVSAPAFLQAQRVLRRPGMTPERLAQVRRSQMPDAAKRKRADAVIPTGLGGRPTLRALTVLLRGMRDEDRTSQDAQRCGPGGPRSMKALHHDSD